jgi:hypothetical protein
VDFSSWAALFWVDSIGFWSAQSILRVEFLVPGILVDSGLPLVWLITVKLFQRIFKLLEGVCSPNAT